MEWWAAVLKILGLKGGHAEEFKVIIAAYRQLNDEYKQKIIELEKELKHLKSMNPENLKPTDVKELLDRETEYLQQIITLTKQKRELQEQIIFLEGLKDRDYQ